MEPPQISAAWLSAIMWIGVGLSAIFIAIRTYVQYRNSKMLFINDHWIFFAMTCHLATAIVYQIAIPPMYEMMYVSFQMQPVTAGFVDRASLFLRLQYALDFMLWTTLWSVKFSLLFFFWRLFDSVQTPMRIFWWTMCAITASTWITCVVLQNFACDPIKNFFILGKCSTPRDIYYSNLIFKFSVGTDIAGDILIMIIPFPLLRKLQINRTKRYILMTIFSLPLIPIIFAILRLVMANANETNVDPIKFQLFSMLENSSAIITSCLPSLRLFVASARTPGHTGSGSGRYYAHKQGGYYGSGSNRVHGYGEGQDSLRMETLVETRRGGEEEDDSVMVSEDGSQKGLRSPKGVLVTQEFIVR